MKKIKAPKGAKMIKGADGRMGFFRKVNGNTVFMVPGDDFDATLAADLKKSKGAEAPRKGMQNAKDSSTKAAKTKVSRKIDQGYWKNVPVPAKPVKRPENPKGKKYAGMSSRIGMTPQGEDRIDLFDAKGTRKGHMVPGSGDSMHAYEARGTYIGRFTTKRAAEAIRDGVKAVKMPAHMRVTRAVGGLMPARTESNNGKMMMELETSSGTPKGRIQRGSDGVFRAYDTQGKKVGFSKSGNDAASMLRTAKSSTSEKTAVSRKVVAARGVARPDAKTPKRGTKIRSSDVTVGEGRVTPSQYGTADWPTHYDVSIPGGLKIGTITKTGNGYTPSIMGQRIRGGAPEFKTKASAKKWIVDTLNAPVVPVEKQAKKSVDGAVPDPRKSFRVMDRGMSPSKAREVVAKRGTSALPANLRGRVVNISTPTVGEKKYGGLLGKTSTDSDGNMRIDLTTPGGSKKGHVVRVGNRMRAFSASGTALGNYKTTEEASMAVLMGNQTKSIPSRKASVDPDPDMTPEARRRSKSASRSRGRAMTSGPESLTKWASENDGWKVSRTADFGTALRMTREGTTYTLYKDDNSASTGWIVRTKGGGGRSTTGYLTPVNKPHTFEQALKLINGDKKGKVSEVDKAAAALEEATAVREKAYDAYRANPTNQTMAAHTEAFDAMQEAKRKYDLARMASKMKESRIAPEFRDFLLIEADMSDASACGMCRHWSGGDKCKAFPKGIPSAILSGENDHSKSYPGDNGITFAPKDDEAMDDQIDTEMDD